MNAIDFVKSNKQAPVKMSIDVRKKSKPIDIPEPVVTGSLDYGELTLDDVLYKSFKKKKKKNGKGSILIQDPDYKPDPNSTKKNRKVFAERPAVIKFIKQEAENINIMDY
jgi:hypothetical protein